MSCILALNIYVDESINGGFQKVRADGEGGIIPSLLKRTMLTGVWIPRKCQSSMDLAGH
ncbi:hypothetical protein ACS0TY_032683 [Phlomoides rotata]